MTFAQWMRAIDAICRERLVLSIYDLADQPFWDWWQDGVEPEEAVRRTLQDEGMPKELVG